MTKSVEAVLRKLDQPPAGHNFARSNFQRRDRTISALVNLALGFPSVSYRWAIDAIQAQLSDGLSAAAAIKLLEKNCPPSQFDHNHDLLLAFEKYAEQRSFRGITVFPEYCGGYMASPDVRVPIRPTAILREDGILKPLFVIGWATNPLTLYQRRLLATMYEDAIYSLTDFRLSEGEVLTFPKNGYGERQPVRWTRSTYPTLSKDEMRDQAERFIWARDEARAIVPVRLEEINRKRVKMAAARRSAGRGPDAKT